MPTVGASDLFLELYDKYDNNDNDILNYNDRLLLLYSAYCKAHISSSSTPLFQISVPTVPGSQSIKEYINVSIALCFLIVATCQQLDVRIKQEATILQDFTENIRTVFIEEKMDVPPIRVIHDIFSDSKLVYSRLLTNLQTPKDFKSYLFADSHPLQGWFNICYDAEDHKRLKLWSIATHDAVYFFEIHNFNSQYYRYHHHHHYYYYYYYDYLYYYIIIIKLYSFPETYRIHSCLPLQFVNIAKGDGQNKNKIEIWPFNDNVFPLIQMSETLSIESDSSPRTFNELSKLAYPEKVNYHQSIFIQLDNNDDNNHWVDILEKNAFNCRNRISS